MNKNPGNSDGRREFLKSGLRTLFFGGILFVSGLLGKRNICLRENENICTIALPCKDCSAFTDCTYSKAAECKQDIPSKR